MALIDDVRSMKADGYSLEQVYESLKEKAPFWLIRVLYSLA